LPSLPLAALAELLCASLYSQKLKEDPWEFALSLDELQKASLTVTNLRYLVHEGYVEHRVCHAGPGERDGNNRPTHKLHFDPESRFLLTASGVALAQRLGAAKEPDPDGPAPTWDRDGGQLLLGGVLIKRFRCKAQSQYAVLDAFQKQGWPAEVANPLSGLGYRSAEERIKDAVGKLNTGQSGARIRFHLLQQGRRVSWDRLPESSQGQSECKGK
jgi:hypothetical protein